MKRTVITVDGNGMLSIPSNFENLWMSESELVDMLYVTAPKLKAVIRAIYKEGMLLMSEVQQRQETSKDIWQTMYGFPMIVAICFRLVSYGAAQLRDAIFKRLYEQKRKQPLYCNSMEEQMPLAKYGRFFNASVIHCRINLPTY